MMLKYYLKNANTEDLYEKLEEKYPHILEAIKKENYHIEYPTCGFIKEILYKDEVVGFLVLQKLKEVTFKYALSEMYVLPEYRSKDIFLNEILNVIVQPNMEIYLRRPSKRIIENLMNCGLAMPLNDEIIISCIPLIAEIDEVYENNKLKKHYDEISDKNEEYLHVSHYYNIKYCGVLISEFPTYVAGNNAKLMLTKPRKNDFTSKVRKNLNKIKSNDLAHQELFILLFDELETIVQKNFNLVVNKMLSSEVMLGSENALSEYMQAFLEENNLTKEDGFRLRKQVIEALDSGEINNKSINLRLNYLIGGPTIDSIGYMTLKCPHCGRQIDYFLKSCIVCGHDLTRESIFKTVEEIANRELDGFDFTRLGDDELQVNAMFTNKLIDRLEQKEYDEEEVFNAQSLYVCYLIIKSLKNNLQLCEGEDLANRIKEGGGLIYGIRHNYIEELTFEKYREILESWTVDKIKEELENFGEVPESDDKDLLIKQIFDDEYFMRFIIGRFCPTPKGEKLLDCELLSYYESNIGTDYLFYEFKTLWDENIEKLSPQEIEEKLKTEVGKI